MRFKLTYYCGERKKHFVRDVVIDDDLEMQRKVHNAVFATITMRDDTVPDGKRKSLLLRKVDGHFVATSGRDASVPAYLFGPEYARAVRVDPSNLWDLRREAFTPIKKAVPA